MKQAPSVFFVWASAFVIFVGVGAQGGPARAADGSDQLPAACRSDSGPSIAKERIGVVLMHGRNGSPRGYIAPLATHLEDRGVEVSTPDMPWSKNRRFDRDFDGAMEEIDKSVARLREAGAQHIVGGGQSQGGMAALGYGARRAGLSGVIVIAGGGDPGNMYRLLDKIRGAVDKAREMDAAGEGDDTATFADIRKTLRTTARIYLSYRDPEGPAQMPRNAAALKPGVPLLWVYGRDDPIRDTKHPDYAFAKAPANAKSAYVLIDAGHLDAPEKARKVVERWLACVAE